MLNVEITPGTRPEVVTTIENESQAWDLPQGCLVGDTCGGRSFSDNIASVLEQRSYSGWRDIKLGPVRWTVILLAR